LIKRNEECKDWKKAKKESKNRSKSSKKKDFKDKSISLIVKKRKRNSKLKMRNCEMKN